MRDFWAISPPFADSGCIPFCLGVKGGIPPNRPLPCSPSRFTPKNSASVTKTTFWKKHCMQTTFHKGHFECREKKTEEWLGWKSSANVLSCKIIINTETLHCSRSVLLEGGGISEGYVRSNLWLMFWLTVYCCEVMAVFCGRGWVFVWRIKDSSVFSS